MEISGVVRTFHNAKPAKPPVIGYPPPTAGGLDHQSHFGLLCQFQGVINLYPQIADGALDLAVAQQQLNGP